MALEIRDDDIGEIVFDLLGKWVRLGLVSTLGECLARGCGAVSVDGFSFAGKRQGYFFG